MKEAYRNKLQGSVEILEKAQEFQQFEDLRGYVIDLVLISKHIQADILREETKARDLQKLSAATGTK